RHRLGGRRHFRIERRLQLLAGEILELHVGTEDRVNRAFDRTARAAAGFGDLIAIGSERGDHGAMRRDRKNQCPTPGYASYAHCKPRRLTASRLRSVLELDVSAGRDRDALGASVRIEAGDGAFLDVVDENAGNRRAGGRGNVELADAALAGRNLGGAD